MPGKNITIAVSAGVLLIAAFIMQGCGQYPEVSQQTYQHAKALYSVCNRKDADGLETCSSMIEEAEQNESIPSSEASYLHEIIATAEADQWNEAQLMARQLMSDQAGN